MVMIESVLQRSISRSMIDLTLQLRRRERRKRARDLEDALAESLTDQWQPATMIRANVDPQAFYITIRQRLDRLVRKGIAIRQKQEIALGWQWTYRLAERTGDD